MADLGLAREPSRSPLADLIGETGHIYSVDKDRRALKEQERALGSEFPAVPVQFLNADFTQWLAVPLLDGIVMANSLHYVQEKRCLATTDPRLSEARWSLASG